jgi:hypothetical protein
MARYDDLNTSTIAYATLVSCLGLVLIVLLLQSLTFGWIGAEEHRKLVESHYTASDEDIALQKSKLNRYAEELVEIIPPADPASTTPPKPVQVPRLHIPISQAQALLKKELNKAN